MSQCEVCGAEIKGEVQYIKIGTAELRVCKSCARYGITVDKKAKSKAGVKGGDQLRENRKRLYEQMDRELESETEIVDNYGWKIKETRRKMGLKQENLARKINEKQSLLQKIEKEEIIPSEEVRKKIERVLNISLH